MVSFKAKGGKKLNYKLRVGRMNVKYKLKKSNLFKKTLNFIIATESFKSHLGHES